MNFNLVAKYIYAIFLIAVTLGVEFAQAKDGQIFYRPIYDQPEEIEIPTLFARYINERQRNEEIVTVGAAANVRIKATSLYGHDIRYSNDGRIYLLEKDKNVKEIIFMNGRYQLQEPKISLEDFKKYPQFNFRKWNDDFGDKAVSKMVYLTNEDKYKPSLIKHENTEDCGYTSYYYYRDKKTKEIVHEVFLHNRGRIRVVGNDIEGLSCLSSGRIILKLVNRLQDNSLPYDMQRFSRGVAILDEEIVFSIKNRGSATHSSTDMEIVCPLEIEVQDGHVIAKDPWKEFMQYLSEIKEKNGRYALSTAYVANAPSPASMVEPDSFKNSSKEKIATWKIDNKLSWSFACEYKNVITVLYILLRSGTTRCDLHFDLEDGNVVSNNTRCAIN